MDTLAFLRRVLPSSGHYVSVVINDGEPPRQGFIDKLENLSDVVQRLSARGDNTYFAVATFESKQGGRKQTNVHGLKALFLDVDCGEGKPYPSWREGLVALGDFVTKTGLPKPLIIHSGNGLHVYWTLDEAVAREDWLPVATALKNATIKLGFDVDRAVPADSARVLRPVGTINPKGGRVVRLLIDAPPTDIETLRRTLLQYAGTSVVPTAPRTVMRQGSLLDNLAVKQDYPPADPTVLASKCAQLRWAIDNQKDVPEPLWYAVMGIAAYCENPEETAVAWSKDHPGFDEATTLRKLEHWKRSTTGPATCSRFESERPDGCKNCVFKDKISTPAKLGLRYATSAVADDAPDETATIVPIPFPFKRTASGIKITVNDTDIDVSSFDIYPVGYGRDEVLGYETVRYRWNRPHVGWQTLSFRQALLADAGNKDFATAIADQGIVLKNKKQTEYFQMMLRAYMDELRQLRSMTNLYSTMGWKEGDTKFLIGGTLYSRAADGTVSKDTATFASMTNKSADAMYSSAGTVEEWAKFTSLTERLNLPVHMFALCVSMSAPLYNFSGLKGLTINLYGPTGSGKTLAQYWQQSVWGDPTKLHYTAKFTQNALFARMGLYNNLPVSIDETTMLPSKEVGDFLYWVSQGRDKARLTRHAEERDAKTWATVVTTSANRSMSSMLVASGMETDAQIARLLEVTVYPHPLFTKSTDAGQKIFTFITNNYGTAGEKLIEHYLSLGEAGIRAALEHHREEFIARYNCKFSGNERFWEQGIMLADFAGKVAKELGIIQFDYTKGTAHVLQQLGMMRDAAKENKVDAFDLLTEYLNEVADQTIAVQHVGSSRAMMDPNTNPRGEVHVRFDLYKPTATAQFDKGVVLLDRKHFKTWLSTRGGDYRSVIKEFAEQGVNATPPHAKAYLGKDTHIKLGQQYVVGVSLNHPRLVGILTNADDATTSVALHNVTVLPGGKA